jgi:hypothetical protein
VLVGRVKVRTNLVRLQAVLLRLAAQPRQGIGKIFARRFSGQQQGGAFCAAGIGAGAAVGDEESSPLSGCGRRGRLLVRKALGKSLPSASEAPLLLAAAAGALFMDEKDPPSSWGLRAVGEAFGSLLLSSLPERLAGESSSRCGKGLRRRIADLLAREASEKPPRPGGRAAGSLSGLPGGAGEQQGEDGFRSAHAGGCGSAGASGQSGSKAGGTRESRERLTVNGSGGQGSSEKAYKAHACMMAVVVAERGFSQSRDDVVIGARAPVRHTQNSNRGAMPARVGREFLTPLSA